MPFPCPLRQLSPILGSMVSPKEPINHPEDKSLVVGGSQRQHKRFRPQSVTQYAKSDAIAFRPKCEEGILSFSYVDTCVFVFFFSFQKRGFHFEKTKTIRTKSFPFIIIYICKYECEMRGVFKCVAIFLLSSTVLF